MDQFGLPSCSSRLTFVFLFPERGDLQGCSMSIYVMDRG